MQVKKLTYSLVFLVGTLVTTSCPHPFIPTLCDAPDSITIESKCYDPGKGLTMKASTIVNSDSSIQLNWTVYILADTAAKAPFNNPQIKIVGAPLVTLPDSVLEDNRKVYVQVNTTCADKDKAPGLRYIAFVKRFKTASSCYQWEEQAF